MKTYNAITAQHSTKLTPRLPFIAGLLLLGLLLLSALVLPPVFAQSTDDITLPDLGTPAANTSSVQPSINAQGAEFSYQDNSDGKLISISPEYSKQTGAAIDGSFATPFAKNMAFGILLTAGADKNEWLFNTGFDLTSNQRFIFSLGQLRQKLDFNFVSGTEKTQITQDNLAASYQYLLGKDWLNAAELNGYISDAGSVTLGDKAYFTDTTSLYELWSDPRRIAGGRVTGVQGRLVFTPTSKTTIKVGLGAERLTYDYLTGNESTTRATGSAELVQRLDNDFHFRASANAASSQNRYALGLGRSFKGGAQLGIDVATIQGRDNTFNDNQLLLSYTQSFGSNPMGMNNTALNNLDASGAPMNQATANTATPNPSANSWASSLVDQVSRRPSFLPSQVIAKVDATATPTRLIAIDKLAAPGAIDNATGIITSPIGTSVISITGITKNGSVFTNAGQFALSGDNLNLIVNPNLITQPAVGVTDTYVVTMNNLSGGGTTLATIIIAHGSRHIKSIAMSSGQIAPTLSGFSLSAASVVFNATVPTISAVSSNSSGAITYTSSNTAVASIDSSRVVSMVGVGTVIFTATQAADVNYASGTITTATLTVTAGSQSSLTASASPSSIVALTGTTTLSTSGGSGTGSVTYSSTGGCTIVGTTLTAGATVGTCTVTAIKAADSNYAVSTNTVNVTVTAVGTQATPTFSPAAGAIAFGTTVNITSANATAIYYTTDGTTPTTSSTNQVTTPLVINVAVTVKALAVKAGYTNSVIASAAYSQAVATAPSGVTLAVGSTSPVAGVTNVAIPAAGVTDATGAVTGWVATTADKIKLTVTNAGSATSSITINGSAYTSGADYTISAASTLTIVVTTAETGKVTGVRTFTVSVAAAVTLPAGYVVSGGLTWTPDNSTASPGYTDWTTANNTCAALTAQGLVAGSWRLPTRLELSALFTALVSPYSSPASPLTTAGWGLTNTWSSDAGATLNNHIRLNLSYGGGGYGEQPDSKTYNVSCVNAPIVTVP